MATRNTRTALTDAQGNNRTASHLSTNIIIKVGNRVVGAIQSIGVKENRSIQMIDELGTDGHIDSAPNKSADFSGDCKLIRFAKKRLFEAFGRGFIHIMSQRIPFDIEIHDTFSDADTNNAVVTTLHNVWFETLSYDYSVSDWIIQESASFKFERISSILANKNVVSNVANDDGETYINAYEQQADRGMYAGSLDAAGVLNAFLSDPTS